LLAEVSLYLFATLAMIESRLSP